MTRHRQGIATYSKKNRCEHHHSQLGLLIAAVALLVGLSASPTLAAFVDVTAAAGVEFMAEAETVAPIGSGTVWGDFDDDGWDDLYMPHSATCNLLFRNLGGGQFAEEVGAAGASDCTSVGHGGSAADYDRDGDLDLYVTNNGQNRLFKNLLVERGFLSFRDATEDAGMMNDGARNSASSVWGDFDEDGYPDLFVANHFTTMEPVVCNPDLLWHNNGDGSFTEVAAELGNIARSGVLDVDGCGLGATWSDYDRDGDVDLLVINDLGNIAAPNRLFRNDGPGSGLESWKFTDVSAESGFDYFMFGMGVAVGDMDRDGWLDYYMVDIGENNLAYNNGDGSFTDIAETAGVQCDERDLFGGNGLVSWGPAAFDADHDGFLDLFVANGGAPEYKYPDLFGEDYLDMSPNFTYRNNKDLTFTENHDVIGVTVEAYNRNMTYCDYDRDGDLDLHVGNLEGLNTLYRNDRPNEDNWLEFEVKGTVGNLDAYGTFVTAQVGSKIQVREVDGGSSFLSRNSPIVHFGLSQLPGIERAIFEFPVGVDDRPNLRHELRDVPVNQRVTVVEPIYTIEPSVFDMEVSPGDTITLDVVVTNRDTKAANFLYWVKGVEENGSERRFLGPIDISLPAGGTTDQRIAIPLSPNIPPSNFSLVFRTGFSPGDIVHQVFTNIVVSQDSN